MTTSGSSMTTSDSITVNSLLSSGKINKIAPIPIAAITINDINMLGVTVLLFAISAAETAIGISLLILLNNKTKYMNKIRS